MESELTVFHVSSCQRLLCLDLNGSIAVHLSGSFISVCKRHLCDLPVACISAADAGPVDLLSCSLVFHCRLCRQHAFAVISYLDIHTVGMSVVAVTRFTVVLLRNLVAERLAAVILCEFHCSSVKNIYRAALTIKRSSRLEFLLSLFTLEAQPVCRVICSRVPVFIIQSLDDECELSVLHVSSVKNLCDHDACLIAVND